MKHNQRQAPTRLNGDGRSGEHLRLSPGVAAGPDRVLARQTDLNRPVALKELSALPVSDPSMGRRFLRESRLAGSLNHSSVGIAKVVDQARAGTALTVEGTRCR